MTRMNEWMTFTPPSFLYLFLYVCLSVRPSVCLCVCLSVCLSVWTGWFENSIGDAVVLTRSRREVMLTVFQNHPLWFSMPSIQWQLWSTSLMHTLDRKFELHLRQQLSIHPLMGARNIACIVDNICTAACLRLGRQWRRLGFVGCQRGC